MIKEEWKNIIGYENYEVSNLGNIRRVCDKYPKAKREHTGYKTVTLYKNNIGKSFYVHRLVATAFIPNPNNFPQVNHKDGNKANNNVENLEWCTGKYNMQHRKRILKQKNKTKHILCVETGDVFESSKSFERITGLCAVAIRNAIHGISKVSFGYHWQYTDKEPTNIDCSKYKKGVAKKDIAKKFGLETATFCWRLRHGWSYKQIKELKSDLANRYKRH